MFLMSEVPPYLQAALLQRDRLRVKLSFPRGMLLSATDSELYITEYLSMKTNAETRRGRLPCGNTRRVSYRYG